MDHRRFTRTLLVLTMMVAGSFAATSTANGLGVTVGSEDALVEVDLDGQRGSGDVGGVQAPAPSAPSAQAGDTTSSPQSTQSAPSTDRSNSGSRAKGGAGDSSAEGARSTSSGHGAAGGGAGTPAAGQSERTSGSAAAKRRATSSRERDAGRDAETTILTHSETSVPLWAIILAGGLGLTASIAIALWLRARRRPAAPSVLESVDPVTGLSSGEEFDRRLDEEMVRARRFDQPLGLMMLDIDGFARLLRSSDPNRVDRALRDVADLIRGVARPTDFLAHIDGGLFAVICPHTSIIGMIDLRGNVERAFRDDEASDWSLNIGVTEMEQLDFAPGEMVARATEGVASRHEARHLVVVS